MGENLIVDNITAAACPRRPLIALTDGVGFGYHPMLADHVGGPIGDWSLAVVGAAMPDGGPGFLLLATRGAQAHAEELQDHTCQGY